MPRSLGRGSCVARSLLLLIMQVAQGNRELIRNCPEFLIFL